MLVYPVLLAFFGVTKCQELPSYDMLEEFRVSKSRGVRKVDGSEPDSVAYRVNPAIHLRKTMSYCLDVYPDGLPSDYSIIATFKVTKDAAKRSWNLCPRGTQMLRTFHRVEKLFDGEWHKLALQVKGDKVKLLVDCEEVSVEPIDNPRPIIHQGYTSIVKRAVRDRSASVNLQQMDVSCDPEKAYSEDCCELSSVCGGYAEIGLTAGRATCTCMPGHPGNQGPPGTKGHRGLPGNTGEPGILGNWVRTFSHYSSHYGVELSCVCRTGNGHIAISNKMTYISDTNSLIIQLVCQHQGTQGAEGRYGTIGQKVKMSMLWQTFSNTNNNISLQGIIGDPGLPGRDGDIGVEAYQGPQGPEGRNGIMGEKGVLGPAGEMGPQGQTGPRGYKGSAAKPGRPGFIGPPGPVGHVGVAGRPGPKVINGEKGEKGPKGKFGDVGAQGLHGGRGKRGPGGEPGRTGPVGTKGVRGDGGPVRFQGPPGPPGPTLPAQHVIEVCKRVVLEQMSTFANSVKRTCAAVCPLYGDVPLGAPGPTGQKGTLGPPGGNGIDGMNGEIGQPGFYGEAGDAGKQGQPGEKYCPFPLLYPPGQRGRPGRAFNGTPGREGERGHVGRPGPRGHPGLRGVPGVCQTTGCALLNNNTTNGSQNAPQRLRRHP
uniref:Zmp:0000000760 n=1 Tax=Salmo trutta TaxID=8032 RepID=A0A674EWX9_SALTR